MRDCYDAGELVLIAAAKSSTERGDVQNWSATVNIIPGEPNIRQQLAKKRE